MLPRASGAFEKTIGGDWYDGFSTIEMKNEESRGFFFFWFLTRQMTSSDVSRYRVASRRSPFKAGAKHQLTANCGTLGPDVALFGTLIWHHVTSAEVFGPRDLDRTRS